MIRIYADRRGDRYRLYVEGHAGEGATGARICAAVSALTGALVQFARERAECRFLRYSLARGQMYLSCRGGLQNAFEMVLGALLELAREHPESLVMTENREEVNERVSV